LERPLQRALTEAGLLDTTRVSKAGMHFFFVGSTAVFPALTLAGNASPWPMGIPRLKLSRAAPSRSSLKLEEALLTFLTTSERAKRIRPGLRVVDLGAAPGGWSWVMAERGLKVVAVDNGALAPALLNCNGVLHLREDGLHYRPPKPVDWLLCDIVEQPRRIAELAATWCAEGWCREAIFNLKLPMKKRLEEIIRCRALIETACDAAGIDHSLSFKQLYHDRLEVTGHFHRLF
jgi:23S rRNA (cytidine2498-2'-O)-methyltransferase